MSRWLTSSDLINNLVTISIVIIIVMAVVLMSRSAVWGPPLQQLRRNRRAMFCLAVLLFYGGIAVLDSIRWEAGPHGPSKTALDYALSSTPVERTYSYPLSSHEISGRHPRPLKHWHLLGTDALGNDVFVKTLKAFRTAWIVGGFTLVLSIPFAILFGITSGYFGGIVDDVVQYIYVTLSSIPDILLLAALMMVLGRGLIQICVALAVTQWVGLARLLRGDTLKHREKEYVLAARAVGVHPVMILFRHILPNVLYLVIISATLSFSGLVLSETVLSYIGIGVPRDVGSWGLMIDGARLELSREPLIWWNIASAATALFILVLAANFFGDAVRDAFDPRLREG